MNKLNSKVRLVFILGEFTLLQSMRKTSMLKNVNLINYLASRCCEHKKGWYRIFKVVFTDIILLINIYTKLIGDTRKRMADFNLIGFIFILLIVQSYNKIS